VKQAPSRIPDWIVGFDFIRVELTSCVPYGEDLDGARRNPIDHAVASVDELANLGSANFRHAATPIRKAAKNLHRVE
jgi:hypothetical protein